MQGKISRDGRQEYRRKILQNIWTIVREVNELEKTAAGIRNHLHLHERYFFRQQEHLVENES